LGNASTFIFRPYLPTSTCQKIDASQNGQYDNGNKGLKQAGCNFFYYQEAHNQHDEAKYIIFKMIHFYSLDVLF